MATSTFFVSYRPVKIGFIVKHNNIEDIVKASELNTLLWGGIYNPLIPVSKDVNFTKQLIRLFNIDILFPISKTREVEILLKEYEYLQSPHYLNREILYEDWHTKKQEIGYLDIINIINFHWEREFKNKPKDYQSNCVLVEWKENDKLANLFTIMFGRFPDNLNLKFDYKNVFLKGLKATKVKIKANEKIKSSLSQFVYPLALTSSKLKRSGDNIRSDGIFIGNSEKFEDLLTFWNLRAAGINLQFLPSNTGRLNSFNRKYLSMIDKEPDRYPNIEDFIYIYSKNINGSKKLIKAFKTKKSIVYSGIERIIWNGLNIKPINYYFDYKQVLGNIDQKFDKYSVSIALPEKFIKENKHSINIQDIMVVINSITEFDYPEHTLSLPFIQELNEFYGRQIVFDPWELRIQKNGIGLIRKFSDNVVNLYPLQNIKLIEKIFDFVGIKAQISQPGRLTYWIIHQMRENEPLEACRVFKIRGVRKLIKEVSSKGSIGWIKSLKVIGSSQFNKFKKLFIESRKDSELKPRDAWNFLLKKQIFKPILLKKDLFKRREKSFRCMRCGLESKINWIKFSDNWICEFCGYKHYLPQFMGEIFNKNELEMWGFKKSNLFLKDNNQEGAIPVILTLLQIKRRFHSPNFIFSTSLILEQANNLPCETDLVVLNYRDNENIEVGIGECKSDSGKIDNKDITNLKIIRKQFEKKGLKCYLIFSKTADKFAKDEIGLFKKLTKENINPILFTNKELEPYEPYEEYNKSDLPRPYAFTLEDMARNSSYIYLR